MVYQFYGPGSVYHSLVLDAGDTEYVSYDPVRFDLVVNKPLYDKLVSESVFPKRECCKYFI